ncbi:MAG: hypothetical protein U0R26_08725 [Solirubrobacterales bacterium]
MRSTTELIRDIEATSGEFREALEPYRQRLEQLREELHEAKANEERVHLSFDQAQTWLKSVEQICVDGPITAKGEFRSSGDGEDGLENYDGTGIFWFTLTKEDFVSAYLTGGALAVETTAGHYMIEHR